jgi:hypothetical protein
MALLAVAIVVMAYSALAAGSTNEEFLATLRAEVIPVAGAQTEYGIPLSLESLPQFVEWWYTMVPAVEADPRYYEALSGLVAPCCDDNTAFKCCCEKNGQACNIIRSGKGLAAHLIQDLNYTADQIQAGVLQWFQFTRSDYYMAAALRNQGKLPMLYGLTTQGSCYRGLCETPISEGGCGGMTDLIEPAIETSQR